MNNKKVPLYWDKIYQNLIDSYELNKRKELNDPNYEVERNVVVARETIGIPTPLILAGWIGTTVEDKLKRWKDMKEWAYENGLDTIVDSLDDEDYYYFD